MQSLKTFSLWLIVALTLSSAAGCSSWVYRINIPQGNFLEQSDVDKLRVNMTREQVIYVLGRPIAEDAFDKNTWRYVYSFNKGRANEQFKSLVEITSGINVRSFEIFYILLLFNILSKI